jgi:hypothetical protein
MWRCRDHCQTSDLLVNYTDELKHAIGTAPLTAIELSLGVLFRICLLVGCFTGAFAIIPFIAMDNLKNNSLNPPNTKDSFKVS